MKKYNLEIIDFKSVKIIGRKIEVKLGKNAKKHWEKYLSDGSNDYLQKLDKVSSDGDCVGWMGKYNPETKSFFEIPGVLVKKDFPVPEGFDFEIIPDCKMAILWIEGDTPDLEKGAHNLLLKHLNKTEYTEDYSYGFSMEYYTSTGYVNLNEENPIYRFGYFLPCKLKCQS